jgi:hypothetical protein
MGVGGIAVRAVLPFLAIILWGCGGTITPPGNGPAEAAYLRAQDERLRSIATPVLTAKEANIQNPSPNIHTRVVDMELDTAIRLLPESAPDARRLSTALNPATSPEELASLYAEERRKAGSVMEELAAKEAAWRTEREALRAEYDRRLREAERQAARNKLHMLGGIFILGMAGFAIGAFFTRSRSMAGAAVVLGLSGSMCFALARIMEHQYFNVIFGSFVVLCLISVLIAGWVLFITWWRTNHSLEKTVESVEESKAKWTSEEVREFEDIAGRKMDEQDKLLVKKIRRKFNGQRPGASGSNGD